MQRSPYRFPFGFRSILPLVLMPALPLLLYAQLCNDSKRNKR